MQKKWMGAVLGAGMAILACQPVLAADGTWLEKDGGWQYRRANGSMAKGTWEDIDGEWYFFGDDLLMETGWHKIGNLRYYFEDNGALAEGWQCYSEDGKDRWYYFNSEGNAVIQWLYDGGKWYWFNSSGVLSTEASKTIDSKKYYFHEDGSLRANEYSGIKYIDASGQLDSDYDVKGEKKDGNKMSIGDDDKEEIEEQLNSLPSGWLKKFVDDDWRFIYCPEKDYYSSIRFEDSTDRYYVHYKLQTSKKRLYFTTPEALPMAFGEYVYQAARTELKEYKFADEAEYAAEQIVDFAELPESCQNDDAKLFAALFEKYLDEGERAIMETDMDDVTWVVQKIINGRKPDGTLAE